jgi:hypothetical protein
MRLVLSALFLSALLVSGLGCSDGESGPPPDAGADADDGEDASGGDMAGDDGSADDGGDLVADADSKNIDWEALNGTVPPQALPAPYFTARNRDDTPRARPDLIGHPTVIWFYPKANTSG